MAQESGNMRAGRGRQTWLISSVVLVVLTLLVVATRGPLVTSRGRAVGPTSYDLLMVSSRAYASESGDYRFVEGRVKNVSGEPLHNVAVVATWYDADGRLVKTSTALIGHNPFVPGNTSEFRVVTPGAQEMKRFSLEFRAPRARVLRVEAQQEEPKP